MAFETMEAARWISWLKSGGTVLVNRQQIVPMSVSSGNATYLPEEDIESALRAHTEDVAFIEGLAIAERLGNPRLANTALLGALSARLEIDPAVWLAVIERRVPPKYVALNREAFWEGREAWPAKARPRYGSVPDWQPKSEYGIFSTQSGVAAEVARHP